MADEPQIHTLAAALEGATFADALTVIHRQQYMGRLILHFAQRLPLAAVGIWFVYRIVRGWLALRGGRPMYV